MICYVDIEHENILNDPEHRNDRLAGTMDVKYKLEEISGQPCLVLHYRDLNRSRLRELSIQALFISGNVTVWPQYDLQPGALDELHHIIREATIPIFGFCGGMQTIALAHGAEVGEMGSLGDEPQDPGVFAPGYITEWGFTEVEVVRDDPVFEGLGKTPSFIEAHFWEVKEVPEGFDLLASTDVCRVQMIRRTDRPVYGAQFHPEAFTLAADDTSSWLVRKTYPQGADRACPDGRKMLDNFCRVAGLK